MHLPGLRFEPGSEFQLGTHQSSQAPRQDVSGVVSGVVFEPGLSFVHVSNPISGVVFELGSELPVAAPFNRIELLRSSWTRC